MPVNQICFLGKLLKETQNLNFTSYIDNFIIYNYISIKSIIEQPWSSGIGWIGVGAVSTKLMRILLTMENSTVVILCIRMALKNISM